MLEGNVKVINRLGLHARASAQLVKAASRYSSKIQLKRIDRDITANAKSILSVLTLAAGIGTTLEVKIDGEDEDSAFEEITRLFSSGFGES